MLKFFLKSCVGILLSLLLASSCWASAKFDGDDVISVGDSASLDISGAAMSFSVWVKAAWAQDGSGAAEIVFGKMPGTDDNAYRLLFLGVSGIDDYRFRLNTSSGSVNADTVGVTFSANTWHHLAGRYDGSNMFIYFDGALEASPAQTGNISTNDNSLLIGEEVGGGQNWNGEITELVLWDIDIGADGVAQMYNSGLKNIGLMVGSSTPVGYWPLDDQPAGTSGDGETARDLSGNGNDGTLDDGINNAGMTWEAETILSYPSSPLGGQ